MAWYEGIKGLLLSQPLLLVGLPIVYLCSVAIYRLYFSPLAQFPGPKLAALTTWYGGYHDLVNGGQYVWVVEEMHRKYGPVVRVRPDALHVNEPGFIEKLYSQSPKQRRERYWTILQTLGAPGSILATRDHDLHRKRRGVLNPYFSQQNVRRLEPLVNDTLANLLYRMEGWARDGTPIHMNTPFRAATKDVIQAYCFGEGKKFLDMEDCNAAFFDVMTPQRVSHLGTHVYWLAMFMIKLPPTIMIFLLPRVGAFATFVEGLHAQIDEIKQAKDLPEGKTIFHEMLRSDIPHSEKETKRLGEEAMVILIAGSETTASTLAAIMYHLLADRQLLARLKAELQTVMPDPNELPVASKLESLPFLNALIQETIRLYPGATHRQDRVAPDDDLVLETSTGRTFVIPAGTAVGMTAPIINRHPALYDRPDEFLPDRYLENPKLLKYQFSFSKGARQCLGMNLAYQELQSFVAGIFRRYDLYDPMKQVQGGPTLELYQTRREDVAMYADYITLATYPGSQGLRVLIRN
ncbi:cytochrome P450 [Xylariales sp. AK1849]|nr:cytochrome P450 [Xylariales sp. AK1849]